MPLINIDLYQNYNNDQIKIIADQIHAAVLEAFKVPEGDRYQIIRKHELGEMFLLDTGLGFEREAGGEIVIQVVSRKRSQESKVEFYRLVAEKLEQTLEINPKNLLMSIVENDDSDWSFGYGRAQFLTGEL